MPLSESWDRRIRRAEQLATEAGASASLLAFYARVLRGQNAVYQALQGRQLSGVLEKDLLLVRGPAMTLLREVSDHGPDRLAGEARDLMAANCLSFDALLLAYWREPSDREFFPKAILQPYGQHLAEDGVRPSDRSWMHVDNRCPKCGGAPQVSILEAVGDGEATEGGGRRLLCANCLVGWPFRRVRCASCGQEDEHKLAYFQSPEFEHLRVEACETCHRYLKSVDLGRLGLAIPLVDEVAGAALDLWAREHGYDKVELNLVGL